MRRLIHSTKKSCSWKIKLYPAICDIKNIEIPMEIRPSGILLVHYIGLILYSNRICILFPTHLHRALIPLLIIPLLYKFVYSHVVHTCVMMLFKRFSRSSLSLLPINWVKVSLLISCFEYWIRRSFSKLPFCARCWRFSAIASSISVCSKPKSNVSAFAISFCMDINL